MNKQEFLERLRKVLPQEDREERLNFYSEMIDDRMEEGLSEEEAVRTVGSVENILAEDAPEEIKNPTRKKWKIWEIVLLVLGSPVWLSLLIAAAAVVLSLYISAWAVVVSLWAVCGALMGCAFGCTVAGVVGLCGGEVAPGIAALGIGMVCAGLFIVFVYGCKGLTKGILRLTKVLFRKGAEQWLKK